VRDAQGRVDALQGAFQDITAQHQADQALRLSEERFHLVARATADAIWDWNLATDAMWWNEGMQHLFGIPPHEVLPDSRSWTLRLHPEDSAEVLQSIHAAVRGSASHWSAKYRFRRHDDSYAWVQDRGFLIRDGEGRAVRMVGGMADISAQRLAEIEAQRDAHNHAQLLQLQQRMSSIDLPLPEVLAMVARTVLDQTGARGAQVDLLEGQHLVVYASAGVMVRPLGHPVAGAPEPAVAHAQPGPHHRLP
jgi:PAS domain S-box